MSEKLLNDPILSPGQAGPLESYNQRQEKERKKREEERKRKEAEARRQKAAGVKKPAPQKDFTTKGPLPIPDLNPLNQLRNAIRPTPGKESKGLGAAIKGTLRTVDRGLTGLVEGGIEAAGTAVLGATSIQQRLGEATGVRKVYRALGLPVATLPAKYDPLAREFEELRLNGPKSAAANPIEKMGGDVITWALGTMAIARRLPQTGLTAAVAGKGKGVRAVAAAASGAPSGAIADFLLTKKGDGNLANMVDALPIESDEFKSILKLGLAEDKNDSALTARLKATLVGGAVGGAADALSYLFFARRATQAFIKEGMDPNEAIQRGVAEGAMDLEDLRKAKATQGDQEWPEATSARFAELDADRIEAEAKIEEIEARIAEAAPKKAPSAAPEPQEPAPTVTKAPEAPRTQTDAEKAAEVEGAPPQEPKPGDPDPTTDPDLSPDELELKAEKDRLQRILNEQDQLEADLATPPEMLDEVDRATFDDVVDPNEAAAADFRVNNQIPKAARNPDAPKELFRGKTPSPVQGYTPHVHTDAAYKLMASGENASQATIRQLKKTSKLVDPDKIAASLGVPMKRLHDDVGDWMRYFRNEGQNLELDELMEAMWKNDLLTTKVATKLSPELTILTPTGKIAYKTMVTDTSNQLLDLAKKVKRQEINQESFGNLTDRITDRVVALHELHAISASVSGYDLRVFQEVWNGDLPIPEAMKRIGAITKAALEKRNVTKRLQESKQLRKWARDLHKASRQGGDPEKLDEFRKMVDALILSGGDPLKQVNLTRAIMKGLWNESITQMYNSMLSGPATQLRNLTGAAINMVESPASILMNGIATSNPAVKYAALSAYHGIVDSLSDALKVARRSAMTDFDLHTDPQYVVDFTRKQAEMESLRGSVKPGSADDYLLGALEAFNWFNKTWAGSYPQRLLLAGDDFTKTVSSRMKLSMDAAHDTYKKLGKTDHKEFVARYEALKEAKIDPETYAIKDADLLDYAKVSTFNADPGNIANAVSTLLDKAPPLRLAIPFVKVPANVLIYSREMMPETFLASKRYKAVMSLKEGDVGFDPVLRAQYQGRQAVAAITFAAAAAMAAEGNLTGNGPPPGPLRDAWLSARNRPKSVRIPGIGWVEYTSFDPIQMFAAAAADVMMLANMGHIAESERLRDQLVFTFGMSITDRSMLQGVVAMSAWLDPKGSMSPDRMAQSILGTANNFLPSAGLRRAMSHTFEPYRREFDAGYQKVLATAWPGFSKNNPPMVNPLTGKFGTNFSGGLWNAATPFKVSADRFPEGSVEARAQKVMSTLLESNWESGALTTTDSNGIKLNAEQRSLYNKALHQAGLLEHLEDLFDDPRWQAQMKKHKAEELSTEASSSDHYKEITRRVTEAKRRAEAILLDQNEGYRTSQFLKAKKRVADANNESGESRRLREQIDGIRMLTTPLP